MAKSKLLRETIEHINKTGGHVGPNSPTGILTLDFEAPHTVVATICSWKLDAISKKEIPDLSVKPACLKIIYREGYPCPPWVEFVNPNDHADNDAKWWPMMACKCDPVEKKWSMEQICEAQQMNPGIGLSVSAVQIDRESMENVKKLDPAEYEMLRRYFYNPLRIASGVALHRAREGSNEEA